jgi:hypothetical protein
VLAEVEGAALLVDLEVFILVSILTYAPL